MLIKKLISCCIIFETNKYMFIEIVICMAVDCKIDSRKGKA